MPSIDWSFDLLESLITDRGDDVIHEKAVSCSNCRIEDAYASNIYNEGQPATAVNGAPGCLHCGGTGWLYRDACVVHGLVTQFRTGTSPQLNPGGFTDPGDCTFSPSLRAQPVTDWDKITIPYPAPVGDGQTIMRGAGTLAENKTLDTGLDPQSDRLWYMPTCIIWCEDQHGVVYNVGVDFVINGKLITWIGNSPKIRDTYTVKYLAYHEFIVVNTPLIRFDNNRSLAPAVALRKWHVVFPNAYKFDTVKNRTEEQILFTTKSSV